MKRNYFLILLFVSIYSVSLAQDDGFDSWDINYPEVDIVEMLDYERFYADSIEANLEIPQYYSRTDKYSFIVSFSGEKRKLDGSILNSMRRVFKLFMGDPDRLNSLVSNEFKFYLGDREVWMPIQKVLEKPLKNEVKKGEEVKVYCLFFNEHTESDGLLNIFFDLRIPETITHPTCG